ncbi:MAG TPA: CarD family transcriptional regulator, partial [Sphingobacteriaceae bacterium]|nr:CarD family transcriptional regulator [Sphingobacteriaceae bacterium]
MNISNIVEQFKKGAEVNTLVEALEKQKSKIALRGLIGSADALLAISSHERIGRTAVFVLPNHEEASFFLSDLENILDREVLFFPSSFRKPFDFTQSNSGQVLQRAEALNTLHQQGKKPLVVTYPEALAEKVINRQELSKNTLVIQQDAKLGIEFINEFLIEYDFERVDFVYEPGQFSIRGGIVDIFSFSNDLPYRVEFFGDTIESIRTFDIESQLSVSKINSITILPNVQAKFLTVSNISLLEYIDSNAILWFKDVQLTLDVIKTGYKKATTLWKALSESEKAQNPEWIDPKYNFSEEGFIADKVQEFPIIEFGKQFFYKADETIQFNQKPQPSFNKDFNLFIHHLKEDEKKKFETYVFSDSPKQVERIFAILDDLDKSVHFTPIHIALRQGFTDENLKIVCFTDHQIFDRYYKYKLKKGYTKSQAITLKDLRDLKPGDYITHIDHGVGKYAGLEKLEVNGKIQESIRLLYADNDLLYVNINSLNRISKYSGKEGAVPKMNKLGTDTWEKLKKTTKKKVKDIARDLIKLYAQRKGETGNAFSPDSYLQTELEASFIYEDTPDQEKSTADVKKDMESPHPMDRLVCGDVGFGKTEIAVRAAFKAVADNKQVAVLVPTTILALQHYKTFTERLED